jgi:hypothetical protein
MVTSSEMMHCLDLVATDLCEAHAANWMLTDIGSRYDSLAKFNGSEARFGLRFIEHVLALRLALAVNRTLQGASGDKVSFARLLNLAKAGGKGVSFSDCEWRLDELRNGEAAGKLWECRTASWRTRLLESLAPARE